MKRKQLKIQPPSCQSVAVRMNTRPIDPLICCLQAQFATKITPISRFDIPECCRAATPSAPTASANSTSAPTTAPPSSSPHSRCRSWTSRNRAQQQDQEQVQQQRHVLRTQGGVPLLRHRVQRPICMDCFALNHHGHACQSLAAAATACRSRLQSLVDQSQTHSSNLEEAATAVAAMREEAEAEYAREKAAIGAAFADVCRC